MFIRRFSILGAIIRTKERYIISKHTNTSYLDVGDITPTERAYLIEFIKEDLERKRQIIQQQLEAQGLKY